jgi:type I restriction enzyme S subunit
LAYGESLAGEDRVDGTVPVYGSNGPVGVHDRPNTKCPVIVVGRKGSYGKLQFSYSPVFAIDTTYFVDPTTTPQDLRWLFYALRTARLDTLTQDVGVPGLSREAAYAQRLPLPDPTSQRLIADLLDAETARIDALVAKKRHLIELLDERFQNQLSSSLDRFTWSPLRRFVHRIDVGIAEAATHAYAESGVPLLRSMNIRPNRLETDDLLYIERWFADRNKSKYIRAGDILTVRTGNPGVSAVVPAAFDMSQCFTQLISTPKPGVSGELLASALNSRRAREYFDIVGWGSAQTNISVPLLASCPVPDVPPNVALELVEDLRAARTIATRTAAALQRQVELWGERRQALITAAVTGDLEVAA